MNTDKVTTEIVLSAKGPTTRAVGADVGLQPVRIMGPHVRLEIVRASEGPWARGALVFLPWVSLDFFNGHIGG
jgi:hypothetical protein